MAESVDIAIVGAGAAGMTAGIFAKQASPNARVVLLDGAKKPGAKILVAGGGRCNVTHHQVDHRDYNAASGGFVKSVLKSFTADDTVEWMKSLGVTLKREATGKLFPTTDKARTVLDALLGRLDQLGAELWTECRVTDVEHDGDGFHLTINGERRLRAKRLILSPGGRSLPKTGSDGGGYPLVKALGHTVTPTHPALVSIVLQQHWFHADVTGASHEAELTTLANGKPVDRRAGSLLWTHFGLSGPLVMDASRHLLANKHAGRTVEWRLNLLPGERFETVESTLVRMAEKTPKLAVKRVLEQWSSGGASVRFDVPDRVLRAVFRWADVDGEQALAHLKRDDRRRLVHALIDLPLPVEQERGWNHAEVTAGGVPLGEVSWKTMASKACDGLHLAGEILDLDGRIGGFNFQWAWATGRLAGRAAAG